MKFIFEQLRTGGDRNFAYLIADRDSGEAALVDPSNNPEMVLDRVEAQSLRVRYIINTHGHSDHTNGNELIKNKTSASILAAPSSLHSMDKILADGEIVSLGNLELKVIHTPGHTPDHLVVFCEAYQTLCTGDLLFVGKVGGTSTKEEAENEWQSLRRLLEELPQETTVWPGHDYGCRSASSLALEAATNPFLLCKTLDEFLDLKQNWSEFKAAHGLK